MKIVEKCGGGKRGDMAVYEKGEKRKKNIDF